MNDRELADAMAEAARIATARVVATGLSRSSHAAVSAARAAAADVYRAERPGGLFSDPVRDRMEARDEGDR